MVIKIDKNIKYFKIKKPLESISASFSNISSIEPEIFKVKEWFQVKVPIHFSFQSSPIAFYGWNKCYYLQKVSVYCGVKAVACVLAAAIAQGLFAF